MKRTSVFLVPCALAALVASSAVGCGNGDDGGSDAGPTGGTTAPIPVVEASAVIEAKSGSAMKGLVLFAVEGDTVTAMIEVTGAPPGEHAVHIHEHGDCSSDDAMSAGGHWNPTMQDHGRWGVEPFHLGDIGNMTVDANGVGKIRLTTTLWTVGTGESNDIVGHAIMVHADPDDFVSQPSGNAGARIGCGVIESLQ